MEYDINALKRNMLVKYPFFGSVVSGVDYKKNRNISTAATDGKTIYYNPEYLEGLSVSKQTFVLAHEVCHIAFNHILRSEGKDPVLWNVATDAVINQFLKRDGLEMVPGVVDMAEAINYDAEELYEKLLKEKQQKQQNKQDGNQQNQQNNGQHDQSQSGSQSGNDEQEQEQQGNNSKNQEQNNNGSEDTPQEKQQNKQDGNQQNQQSNGQHDQSQSGSQSGNDEQEQEQQGNNSKNQEQNNNGSEDTPQEKQQNKQDGNQQNQQSNGQHDQSQSGSQSGNDEQGQEQQGNDSKNQEQNNNDLENTQQGKQQPSKKDIGHDTHNMWERAVNEHKKKQEKSGKKSLLDKILGRDKKPEEKTELEKEQEKNENLGEKDAFKHNFEDKKRALEEVKQEISNQTAQVATIMSNVGTTTNGDIRIVNNIGSAKPLLNWQYILKEAIKYDVDWSYKNATIEDGVVVANLEELPMPETEIVLDTSGSINEILLKNFLRECKNILQHSRLKVGCFDTEFYGFHDIRTEKDIEDMKFEGGGGTDFNAAVRAFSKRVENKIIFTDGESSMPDMPLNAIWIVFGDTQINPKGGKVIRITPEQLRKLCSFEVENETKGRSR